MRDTSSYEYLRSVYLLAPALFSANSRLALVGTSSQGSPRDCFYCSINLTVSLWRLIFAARSFSVVVHASPLVLSPPHSATPSPPSSLSPALAMRILPRRSPSRSSRSLCSWFLFLFSAILGDRLLLGVVGTLYHSSHPRSCTGCWGCVAKSLKYH